MVLGLPKAHPGTLTQLLGGWSGERPVQLISLRQEPNILQGIEAAKPLDGPLPSVQLPSLVRLLNQPFHLNPGIAADLLEKIQQEPLLGFTELRVVESEEHVLNPGIAGRLGFNAELQGPESVEKLANVFERFDGCIVHDDVHPSS